MKPPIPTTNQQQAQASTHRRGALVPMAAGLLTIIAFAVYSWWQDTRQNLPVPLLTGQMAQSSFWGEVGYRDEQGVIPTPRQAGELIMRPQWDRPLIGEPANLPAPQRGRRIGGFMRRDGDIAESVVFWDLPGSTAAAAEYYAKAAKAGGFTALPQRTATTTSSDVANAVYTRSRAPAEKGAQGPPADQVLVVRAIPRGNSHCLVTLIYRHRYVP